MQLVSILIILLALATYVIFTQIIRRRRDVPLRPVQAFEQLPLMVGESIEAGRPLHASFGHSGLGGDDTIATLAAAELFYQVAQRAALGESMPIITASQTSALPVAQDTLRRAYLSRDRLGNWRPGNARWHPAPSQPLAFAAALTATIGDDRVSGNVLAGSFGPEVALVLDQARRRGTRRVATSVALEGQAVAYAMADSPLIGEEIFTAGGYLGDTAGQRATIVTQDILRWLLILAILVPVANTLTDGALFEAVFRLFEGR